LLKKYFAGYYALPTVVESDDGNSGDEQEEAKESKPKKINKSEPKKPDFRMLRDLMD
jgi:hypothetical protein